MTDIEVALELLKIAKDYDEQARSTPDSLLELYRKCLETVRFAATQKPE